MTAVLVAALTAIPSVIAAPAAVATLLPEKYTLRVSTPTSGSPIQNYLGQVTRDSYAGRKSTKSHICLFVQCNWPFFSPLENLNIGIGSNQDQIPVVCKYQ